MALFWRIWAAMSLVNVVVLSAFLGLAALQYASINATLVNELLVVLAARTVEIRHAKSRDPSRTCAVD